MSFASFGTKIIEDRIRAEILNLIESKVSSQFLASVLPLPLESTCPDGSLLIRASAKLHIGEIHLDFTVHAGGDTRKTTVFAPMDKDLMLETRIPVRKPADFDSSHEMRLPSVSLNLETEITDVEFRKMMIGVGATVHGAKLSLSLKGSASALWCSPA